MSEEKKSQEQKDPMKEMKATPQGMTNDEFTAYIRERARRDPRYRRGGSRWKERGE